jgi:hypothetical protein
MHATLRFPLARRSLLMVALMLAAAPPASAADPILPLGEVRPGMSCTGLSVIRGTAISSFDVEIIDVIAAEAGLSGPRILVRVSGPAVDATGVGPGFSGSPILCNGRNAGAISEATGDYGNHVVLATPIEEMLRERPRAPISARRDPALLRGARPLAAPLTVSGLSGRGLSLFERAARRAGRPVLAAPPGPQGGFDPAPLVPGAAAAASISTGDLAIGAVGTVTYRDGDRIWAFGHALDGRGRRSLFLTDAYVFSVIDNPLGIAEGAITYKLASSGGHVQGAITSDGFASIAGNVGAPPASIPLQVTARDGRGRRVTLNSELADERPLRLGAGMAFVAPLGLTQAVDSLLGEAGPTRLSVCARFHVRERRRPIGYCNPYFGIDAALLDLTSAAELVDSYDLSALHIQRVQVNVRARPGIESDVIVGARAPRRVRRGERIRVRLALQRRNGGRRTLSVPVRVPRDLRPGTRMLVVSGNGGVPSLEDELISALFEVVVLDFGDGGGAGEPHSLRELAAAVGDLRNPLGISARLKGRRRQLVHRSDELSFEGRARVRLRVAAARRFR